MKNSDVFLMAGMAAGLFYLLTPRKSIASSGIPELKYFKLSEFKDKHANIDIPINDDTIRFLVAIDNARDIAGIPFNVISGYRTPETNRQVGGVDNSAHLRGLAADLVCADSTSRYKMLFGLLMAGFNQIGLTASSIHCEMDSTLKQNIIFFE